MTGSPEKEASGALRTAVSPGNEDALLQSPWLTQPGRMVAAKYRVAELLGRGGMGVVVAGVQVDLERPVAIKFLRPELAQDLRPARRFALEARAIAKMRSEHVVRVFDVGETEGVPFIVMERLHGSDLAAELKRGPLPLALAVEYLLQACEAIAEAHSLGIVHRDLKPSNLFLAEGFGGRRQLKVLDFGVSKWLGPHELDMLQSTGEGSFIGTPAYVSPEQLTRPETVDPRADVWALGVVLYQCLSGRLPFEADSIPRLCAQILTATPDALESSLAVPGEVRRVISLCLRKDPAERCASVLDLARALSPFAGAAQRPLDGIVTLSTPPAPKDREEPVAESQLASPQSPQTTLTFGREMALREASSGVTNTPRRARRPWLRAAPLPVALPLLLLWAFGLRRADESRLGPVPSSSRTLVAWRPPLPETPSAPPAPPAPAATPSSSALNGVRPNVVSLRTTAPRVLKPKPTKAGPAPAEPAPPAAPASQSHTEAAAPTPDPLDPARLYRR